MALNTFMSHLLKYHLRFMGYQLMSKWENYHCLKRNMLEISAPFLLKKTIFQCSCIINAPNIQHICQNYVMRIVRHLQIYNCTSKFSTLPFSRKGLITPLNKFPTRFKDNILWNLSQTHQFGFLSSFILQAFRIFKSCKPFTVCKV